MKKAAIVIVSIVAIIAVIIGVVFTMTSGMTDTATDLFTDIKAKDYAKAYSHLSEDFKATTSEDEFVKFLEKSALLNFRDTSWTSRSISGAKGEIEGSVITESGGAIPIKLEFVKENDLWKVYSMYKPKAGLSQEDSSGKLPSTEELVVLTDESLLQFANAVNAKSFEQFHGYISHLWQKQFSVEKFNEVFQPFMDADIDLVHALNANSPEFDAEPSINENGFLVLTGHYPTEPSKIFFELKYVFEGVNWKLAGINVNVK